MTYHAGGTMFKTRKQLAAKVRYLSNANVEMFDTIARLKERERAADAEIEQLRSKLTLSDGKVNSLLEEIADLGKENKYLAKMVREQAAADLLLNALQAVGIIREPQEKQKPFADYAHRQQQLANLMTTQASSGDTLLGGLFSAGASQAIVGHHGSVGGGAGRYPK